MLNYVAQSEPKSMILNFEGSSTVPVLPNIQPLSDVGSNSSTVSIQIFRVDPPATTNIIFP